MSGWRWVVRRLVSAPVIACASAYGGLLLVLAVGYACWVAPRPVSIVFILAEMVYLMVPGAAAVCAVGALAIGAIVRQHRTRWVEAAIGYTIMAILAQTVKVRYDYDARVRAFQNVPDRAAPLVQAINDFEASNGLPPDSLEELVPRYLKEIPFTGLAAYPEFDYSCGKREGTVTWDLSVSATVGFMAYDVFKYDPNSEYTSERRVGNWAYIVE